MKKVLCLILALLFTLLFTTVVFAADEKIDDPLVPGSVDLVTVDQYDNIEEFDDELPPESAPVIDMQDENTPEALPQTGGIPAEAFYIAGGVCILSAVLLLTRKSKASTK